MGPAGNADGLAVVTLVFPDPKTIAISGNQIPQLNSSVSFQYESPQITTLSTTNADPNQDLVGLLYLPELDPGSSCENEIFNYVPRNATSQIHLPLDAQFGFLAIAPWISAQCTQEFLYAARDDGNIAFIFFKPDNSTTVAPASDQQWSLGDNNKWKKSNKFPVFAISGSSGGQILRNMGLYSGNLTSVPHGHQLADEFPPSAYVRLAGSVSMDGRGTLPSLWAFLLIVLGILIFIIASTSLTMHCIQKRRRERLRRRVANGEVDLERLGIKRITVPRRILDEMPLYTYPFLGKEEQSNTESAIYSKEFNDQQTSHANRVSKTLHAQPTCAICLDDFISGESLVRELPCYHIFHSECVDTFLGENSSLCPLCKKSSLPAGYCPVTLTHAMVRRERMLRRMRERVSDPEDLENGRSRWWDPRNWRIWARTSTTTRDGSMATPTYTVEMRNSPSHDTNSIRDSTVTAEYATRPEWARQRALDMVGTSALASPAAEEYEIDGRQRARWRRVVSKVWPGLV